MNHHLKRSRNNRRRNVSRKSQRGGLSCPAGQYEYENSCVSQCPKGTYEEEDYLPLTCTHDIWYNRGFSTARVTANKLARATSSAALATSNAAQALAAVSREAAVNAANATSSWANSKLDSASSKIYNNCKQYISNYESALATGKDVSTIPPLSETLLDSNMDKALSTPSVESLPSVESSPEPSVESSLQEPSVSSPEPSVESLQEPSVESSVSLQEPSVESLQEPSVVSSPSVSLQEPSVVSSPSVSLQEPSAVSLPSVDLSFKNQDSRETFSSPKANSKGEKLNLSYSKILNILTKLGHMDIVNELKAAKSPQEVQNILNNAKIDGRSITFYKNSIQNGGSRKRIMISRRR